MIIYRMFKKGLIALFHFTEIHNFKNWIMCYLLPRLFLTSGSLLKKILSHD